MSAYVPEVGETWVNIHSGKNYKVISVTEHYAEIENLPEVLKINHNAFLEHWILEKNCPNPNDEWFSRYKNSSCRVISRDGNQVKTNCGEYELENFLIAYVKQYFMETMKFSEVPVGAIFEKISCPKTVTRFQRTEVFNYDSNVVEMQANCISIDPSPFHFNPQIHYCTYVHDHEFVEVKFDVVHERPVFHELKMSQVEKFKTQRSYSGSLA